MSGAGVSGAGEGSAIASSARDGSLVLVASARRAPVAAGVARGGGGLARFALADRLRSSDAASSMASRSTAVLETPRVGSTPLDSGAAPGIPAGKYGGPLLVSY